MAASGAAALRRPSKMKIEDERVARPAGEPLLRHPAVVAALAVPLAVLAFVTYSGADAVIAAFMSAILVVLAATDLERRIIPNKIVLPAAGAVLLAHLAFSSAHRSPEFLLAALGAGVAFLIPSLLSSALMGMGDVKLALLMGAGLGWGVVGAIVVAYVSVFPFALATLLRSGLAARKATLPFGPFLAFGALVVLIVPRLVGLYGS